MDEEWWMMDDRPFLTFKKKNIFDCNNCFWPWLIFILFLIFLFFFQLFYRYWLFFILVDHFWPFGRFWPFWWHWPFFTVLSALSNRVFFNVLTIFHRLEGWVDDGWRKTEESKKRKESKESIHTLMEGGW